MTDFRYWFCEAGEMGRQISLPQFIYVPQPWQERNGVCMYVLGEKLQVASLENKRERQGEVVEGGSP